MAHTSTTLDQPTVPLRTAIGAVAVAGALVVAVVAAVSGIGTAARTGDTVTGTVAGWPTSPAAIRGQLQSEYLLDISTAWSIDTPRGQSGIDLNRIDSDYLREIAAGW